jgi:CRP-like cAMP-binding protein
MYYFNEEGKEFTCHIAYNETKNLIDNFAIDYHSFSTQTPTIYEIEALSDMEIVEINFDDLNELSSKTKVLEELSEKAKGIMYSTVRDSLIDKNILSNKQRYNDFIQRYEKIHDLIPQYIVASYLGITPVALSRLKNK